VQATLSMLTDAVNSTTLGSGPGVQQVHHISKGTAIAIAVLATIPLVVIPIVATRSSSTAPPKTLPNGCPVGAADCAP
jgi:hypothetical protein